MKSFRKIAYIFTGQFSGSLTNWRIWVGYMLGILVALKSAYLYQGYADGRVIQIFEPFLVNFMNGGNTTLMLIGFIVIIADAPFVNHRSTLMLYRSSRGQWFWGMNLYILVHGILYYAMALLSTMLYSMRSGYIQNIWSRSMSNLVRFPSKEALVRWNMPSPGEALVTEYSPLSALLYTFLLIWMYGFILAVVIFIFNTVFNKAAGTAIAAAIHAVGYILRYDGISTLTAQWSLYYNSSFLDHLKGDNSLFFSVSYMLLIICALLFAGPTLMRHADFKYSSGEQNE